MRIPRVLYVVVGRGDHCAPFDIDCDVFESRELAEADLARSALRWSIVEYAPRPKPKKRRASASTRKGRKK